MSGRIEQYFNKIVNFLKFHPMVKDVSVERILVTRNMGYLKATVTFVDDSQLWIREFVNGKLRKIGYAYHYQNIDGKLVFRYDNAPHHVNVSTFPHHKHVSYNPKPESTGEKNVIDVVDEIVKTIREKRTLK